MSYNWAKLVRELDYKTEHEMWQDLYLTQDLSLDELADRLNMGKHTVRRRLAECNIPIRGRGGDNNGTPPSRNILFHIDQRIVWCSTIDELKQLTGCSIAVISNYKTNARRN